MSLSLLGLLSTWEPLAEEFPEIDDLQPSEDVTLEMAQTAMNTVESRSRGPLMALEKELETFRNKLPELKGQNEGKFVLIHGEDVIDTFTSYDDAINAGYARFGLDPFLVKKIQSIEQAQFISRFVDPSNSGQHT